MKIYTVVNGVVSEGADVTVHLSDGGISFPVVQIGEEGRGRKLAFIPVSGAAMKPCPRRGYLNGTEGSPCHRDSEKYCLQCGEKGDPKPSPLPGQTEWYHGDNGFVPDGRLFYADVGETKSGHPKLIGRSDPAGCDTAIVVLRTTMGFRGGNYHSGDVTGWECSCKKKVQTKAEMPEVCTDCGEKSFSTGVFQSGPRTTFAEFPGKILAKGLIADGDAGRMASGEQLIAVIPAGVVFRTCRTGRLYGAPASHYYKFTGRELLSATWAERSASEAF